MREIDYNYEIPKILHRLQVQIVEFMKNEIKTPSGVLKVTSCNQSVNLEMIKHYLASLDMITKSIDVSELQYNLLDDPDYMD